MQRVQKNMRVLQVPTLWTPTFSSTHLGILGGISDPFASATYRGASYGNTCAPMVLDATASYTNEDPISAYQGYLKNHIPADIPCGPHPQAHCFATGGNVYYPRHTFIKSDTVCDDDFGDVANLDSEFTLGEQIRYHVNWDSRTAREKWVRRMAHWVEYTNSIYRPYRRMTHIYIDNGQLNQQEYPPWFDYNNMLIAVGDLRSILHQYFGARLILNASSFISYFEEPEVDHISTHVDGLSAEQPWHFLLGVLKWDYDDGTNKYGMLRSITNIRRLLNNGKFFISVSGQPWRLSGGSPTYNGTNVLASDGSILEQEWDVDMQSRFDAAMAMIVKPSLSSHMWVVSDYTRQVGTYGEGVYIGDGAPEINEWVSKDWLRWPAEFGAPTSDYTAEITVNGATSYNTATQTYDSCDIIELSRAFENGIIAVDVTADTSDDVNVRYNAVNAYLV